MSTVLPVAPPKDTGATPTPEVGVVDAMRMVLHYTLTDTFALNANESLWLGYRLKSILSPLSDSDATTVPLAVRQELLGGVSSASLARLHASSPPPLVTDPDAATATVEQWTRVIMSMIQTCFEPSPMAAVSIYAEVTKTLNDIGLGDPRNPRPARYLPNDVRFILD